MPGYEELLDNIYRSVTKKDSGERFECPVAETMVQGNKTFVKNFEAVCAKLRRSPAELSKYLFRELAVPGEVEGGRLVLNGKFSFKQVNDKIQDYCGLAVICRECGKPDTHIEVMPESGIRVLVCEACGAKHPIRK
ncbi:MAG: translation initiation factor IF-2 subunit beta [Candidatus Micrarchaeia archaeon]|jgi:translation initiation factor 2 subunit 2